MQGRLLIGVERQSRLTLHNAVTRAILPDAFHGRSNEPLLAEFCDRTCRTMCQTAELRHGQWFRTRGENVQNRLLCFRHRRLAWTSSQTPLHAQHRRQTRAGLLADARRHDGIENLAPRAKVVLRDPMGKAEHGGGQQAAAIENCHYGLSFSSPEGFPFHSHTIPYYGSIVASQRHAQTPPRFHFRSQVVRDRIVEATGGPFSEDHRCRQLIGLVVYFPWGRLVAEKSLL